MTLFEYDFIQFGIKDIVDILIVSFIVYQLLKLMQGTRSVQIIFGLITLAFVVFVSYWFRLEGVTWLFSNLATFGLLAIVIVFQPELRSILAQFGQNRLFRKFFTEEQKRTIVEVSRAVLRLSELRYGGLIVIERQTGLRNFSETGKEINAELSSEMLVTLFTPYTPLHDGAVIVSADLIEAAACSLPLTTNPRYSKLYGMRHKAAIGVTEVSDAVVVVVSEETSQVSIAFRGYLEQDINKADFKDKLSQYLKQ